MGHWLIMAVWYLAGLAAVVWATLIPAHLRAVDSRVLEKAGRGTRGLMVDAEHYGVLERTGTSWTMFRAGELLGVQPRPGLAEDIGSVEAANPSLKIWGRVEPALSVLVRGIPSFEQWDGSNILKPLSSRAARERIAAELQASPQPTTREILRNRQWTQVSRFSPVGSAAGAPLETAICLAGLLVEGRHLAGGFEQTLGLWAAEANQGKPVPALEEFYQELLVIGGRCGWGILSQVGSLMGSPEEMVLLGRVLRNEEMAKRLRSELVSKGEGADSIARGPADPVAAVVLASIIFTESPRQVLRHMERHSPVGVADVALSLRYGAGATRELLARGMPVNHSRWRDWVAGTAAGAGIFAPMLQFSSTAPILALLLKYELILMGAFFLARGTSRIWYQAPAFGVKPPKNVLGLARQAIFAFVVLLSFVYFAEPHLAQGPRAPEAPPMGRFSVARAVVSSIVSQEKKAMPDQYTIITLVLFFVIQASVYAVCLVKLAEIRRHTASSALKLKLLENEENLFDAGLYVGLGGTAATLVFVSLGIIKPSLIAAYSSTLFGIIFVAILKIVHLRPLKRRLILSTEEKPVL